MYRVMWGPEIIGPISKVYDGLREKDRERLMIALESLDARLLDDPMGLGESRSTPFVRVAIEGPLTITFHIDEALRVVRISGVSFSRRKS